MNADQPVETGQTPRSELQPSRDLLTPVLKVFAAIALVVVAVGMLLPATRSAPEAARRNQCLNNLKQIGLALNNYADVHGRYPPAYTTDDAGNRLHSWRTLILPYMEQQALYKSIDLTKPWNDPANALAAKQTIGVYQCPSLPGDEEDATLTNYLATVGDDTVIRAGESRTPEEIGDVTRHALMVIEVRKEKAVHWMSPEDIDAESLLAAWSGEEYRSHHSGDVANALFADSSYHSLQPTLDPAALRAMITVSRDDDGAISTDEQTY
ncbi:DUF1559 domain-containing protein [Lacipirellula sp.]|uniref:DUF1559 family PulG-like putative transporter n=1 Tax=Lacipirellula sp. TaxID=2691419 RepID=UPI003D0BAA4D